jgi:hypothetical protein
VVATLEIAPPERSVLYDSYVYLYFENPKTQILRIDLEATLLKLEKSQKDANSSSKKATSSGVYSPRGMFENIFWFCFCFLFILLYSDGWLV